MRSAYCALHVIVAAMPNYRRAFAPGGCWFFTVNLLARRRRLLTDNIDALRGATRRVQTRHPFRIDAIVVLPDQSTRFGRYPLTTPFLIALAADQDRLRPDRSQERVAKPVRIARGEHAVWQRRFWEHLIRDDEDFRRHVEYC